MTNDFSDISTRGTSGQAVGINEKEIFWEHPKLE